MEERFGDEMENAVLRGWKWGTAIGRGICWCFERLGQRNDYRRLKDEQDRANDTGPRGQQASQTRKYYAEDDDE